jgi:hypothetical protein
MYIDINKIAIKLREIEIYLYRGSEGKGNKYVLVRMQYKNSQYCVKN